MNTIPQTRAHHALRAALRAFAEARQQLEVIVGGLSCDEEAEAGVDVRRRAVEQLAELEARLCDARERLALVSAVVFDDVGADARSTLPPWSRPRTLL